MPIDDAGFGPYRDDVPRYATGSCLREGTGSDFAWLSVFAAAGEIQAWDDRLPELKRVFSRSPE